jgi:septal ring factor EnvC (AmiA/AmiB activator)
MDNVWSVLITVVTVLGSATAFRFYEKRSMRKERDEDFIRHDCKDRISKLEALLAESSREKDEMRKQILDLVSEVASLRTEIKYLTDRRTGSI